MKRIIQWLIGCYCPKFQLDLCEIIQTNGYQEYILKQYGTHEHYKLNYNDIMNDEGILFSINPKAMSIIHENEYNKALEKKVHKIKTVLSGNKFEISCSDGNYICDGFYICENMESFTQLDVVDAMKIAYETGSINSRRMHIKIQEEIKKVKISENIIDINEKKVELRLVK